MEVATKTSSFALHSCTIALPTPSRAPGSICAQTTSSPSFFQASLSTSFVASFTGGSVSSDFSAHKIGPNSLNPVSFPRSKAKRGVIIMRRPPVDATKGKLNTMNDLEGELERRTLTYTLWNECK